MTSTYGARQRRPSDTPQQWKRNHQYQSTRLASLASGCSSWVYTVGQRAVADARQQNATMHGANEHHLML